MKCNNCGYEFYNKNYCPNCGRHAEIQQNYKTGKHNNQVMKKKNPILGILALIFCITFIFGIVGLILAIIDLNKKDDCNKVLSKIAIGIFIVYSFLLFRSVFRSDNKVTSNNSKQIIQNINIEESNIEIENGNTLEDTIVNTEEVEASVVESLVEKAVEVDDGIPTEYKSALKKAKNYSDSMHMSKLGLYNQLTSEYGEQFSVEAAQYAIDNVDTDWKTNALAKAQIYNDNMHFSKAGLSNQLVSEYGEQFTKEEAQYAVDNVIADWNANALAKAKKYQEAMSMSSVAIHNQLTSEYGDQFTESEADYAIEHLD